MQKLSERNSIIALVLIIIIVVGAVVIKGVMREPEFKITVETCKIDNSTTNFTSCVISETNLVKVYDEVVYKATLTEKWMKNACEKSEAGYTCGNYEVEVIK